MRKLVENNKFSKWDDDENEKKIILVIADLKKYRIKQLNGMGQPNSDLIIQYINSKMREGNLKPAT